MADLCAARVGIGLQDMATYMPSGSVAFASDRSEDELVLAERPTSVVGSTTVGS
jgi:uncharacterized protein (DUF1697 family)